MFKYRFKHLRWYMLVLMTLVAVGFLNSWTHINRVKKKAVTFVYTDNKLKTVQADENLIQQVKEQRHIAFLKVHKAASTTAQNIFLRFAMNRDLLVVLPFVPKFFYPNVINNYGTITATNVLPPPTNRSYEVLCCHVVYNRKAFENIMPDDTVYIGIIRDPFEHFISVLNYFRPREVLGIVDPFPVSRFLQNPSQYEKQGASSYVNNRMAFEYDFPADLFESQNQSGILNYLHKLEEEFQFIMVVEQFDESVVLMRRLLNWKMKDIMYLKLNVKKTLYEKIKFNPGDVENYQRWAMLDYALYNHFYQRLQAQIQEQGPDFQAELLYFKRLRRNMEFFCQPDLLDDDVYVVSASLWSEAFNITKTDCHYMKIWEVSYIKEIRLHQYGKFEDAIPKKKVRY